MLIRPSCLRDCYPSTAVADQLNIKVCCSYYGDRKIRCTLFWSFERKVSLSLLYCCLPCTGRHSSFAKAFHASFYLKHYFITVFSWKECLLCMLHNVYLHNSITNESHSYIASCVVGFSEPSLILTLRVNVMFVSTMQLNSTAYHVGKFCTVRFEIPVAICPGNDAYFRFQF
jgi:hypothetical protein